MAMRSGGTDGKETREDKPPAQISVFATPPPLPKQRGQLRPVLGRDALVRLQLLESRPGAWLKRTASKVKYVIPYTVQST